MVVLGVRSSKYRHVFGDPTRKDKCYDNIRLTKNAFDADLVQSNGKYISVNWDASGGGSFAVLPVSEEGKLPDRFPLFDGHKGPVLDTDWDPFDDEIVVSASDDGTIGVWRIPENFSVHVEYGKLDDCPDVSPVKFLTGHGKKIGHVKFNPVVKDVLASASLDNTVKVWNVETGDVLYTLKHPAFVNNFAWNYDGTIIATVANDKTLRIWDVRSEKILSEGHGHDGAKNSRVVWLGDNDRVLTTGFSLVSDREMAIWDVHDIPRGPIGGFRNLDPSSGIVIPHYDPMTSIVYLGGRGDGSIVYYEYADDNLYHLFAFSTVTPQRGLGWVPNRRLDSQSYEVARVYKAHETLVEPISFKVPLRNEGLAESVFTFYEAGEPALTAEEWKSGKTARPLVKWWKDFGKDTKAFPAPLNQSTPEAKPENDKKESPKKTSEKEKSETKPEEAKPKEAKVEKKDTGSENKATTAETLVAKAAAAKGDSSSKPAPSKEEAKEAETKTEEIAALKKAEKQDGYDVLQSKEVQTFLAKNTESDDGEQVEDDDDSAWNEEPPKVTKETKETKDAKEVKETKDSKKTTQTKEAKETKETTEIPKDGKDLKKEQSKKQPEAKEEPKKVESKKEETKKEEPKKEEPKEVQKEPTKTDSPVPKESVTTSAESKPKAGPVTAIGDKLSLILEKLEDLQARVSDIEAKLK